jgi:medium-chain acyl-[acyl-carrier-protein] hydrolase
VKTTYEKVYALKYYDFDKNYRLKPTTLMNFLQDISTLHFETKTADLPEGTLPGLWVIVEWNVTLLNMPRRVMDLTLRTEPTYFRKFIAYRRYEVLSDEGQVIAEGVSKWAYIDPILRKQVNIPKVLNEVFGVPENAEKPAKFEFENMEGALSKETKRKSVYADIDVNDHVNNVTYIGWAIDTLDGRFMSHHALNALKVVFKKEVLEDEVVSIQTKIKETAEKAVSDHAIVDENGALCVQMQFEWSTIPTV